MIDWDKMHEAMKRRESSDNELIKMMGNDIDFWARFASEGGVQKLDKLSECLIVDKRYSSKERMTVENEFYFRLSLRGLITVIDMLNKLKTEKDVDSEKHVDNIDIDY